MTTMLTEETLHKLNTMRLLGMARGLEEQLKGDFDKLAFDERIGMLVDREWTDRESRRLTRRLQQAKLRDKTATIEDIDYRHPRGLDRSVIQRLSTSQWVDKHQNIIITGPTGCGKTYLACALAQKACRDGHTAIYRRVPRLLHEIGMAKADGSYTRLLTRLAKAAILILDDWGLAPLTAPECRDLHEALEDRHGNGSTVVGSQMPVKLWHKLLGEANVADAFLDRIVHTAHKIPLSGGSMRKKRSDLTSEEVSAS
jgi:DNA replication protein DnaC